MPQRMRESSSRLIVFPHDVIFGGYEPLVGISGVCFQESVALASS